MEMIRLVVDAESAEYCKSTLSSLLVDRLHRTATLRADMWYIDDYFHLTSNSTECMAAQKLVDVATYSHEEWKQKLPFALHPFRSFE